MNRLPRDVISSIKAFASDKHPPNPTAKLINTLDIEYKYLAYDNGIVLPYRPEVTATEGRFDWLGQSYPPGSRIILFILQRANL